MNQPPVETNPYGTPVLFSLLERVKNACPDVPFLAYANADILFDNGLLRTLDALLAWNQTEMLAVGRRCNHDLKHSLTIQDVSQVPSELFTPVAQDYFIITSDMVNKWRMLLPPYVIGRRGYDNALVDWAYHHSKLVDLTETVKALHQTTSDGNFAGHSPQNPDKEYNVELPGAVYDHGSVAYAHYQTKSAGHVIIVVPQGANPMPSLQLSAGRRAVTMDELPSPLFVTFGNHAFKEVLASFLCNMALFFPMHKHILVIVTDQATVDYLGALNTEVIIGLHSHTLQTEHDYNTPEYVKLMLLRGQLLLQLLGSRVIVWLEADAEYSENLIAHHPIISASTDLMLYWDGTMYGGGFIRFAATEAARNFYKDVMTRLETGIAKGDFTNDQVILNSVLTTTTATHAEFDRCAFRSGLEYLGDERGSAYRNLCSGTRAVVQHHNWIVGNQNKIEMAKQHGAWFLQSESPVPICNQRNRPNPLMSS